MKHRFYAKMLLELKSFNTIWIVGNNNDSDRPPPPSSPRSLWFWTGRVAQCGAHRRDAFVSFFFPFLFSSFSLICFSFLFSGLIFPHCFFCVFLHFFVSFLIFFAAEPIKEEAPTPHDLPMTRRSDVPTRQELGDFGRASPCQQCPLCGARVRSELASSFPRAVSVHCGSSFQHGCHWPSLCGRFCACTREVFGCCCRLAVTVRVWEVRREQQVKRSGDGMFDSSWGVETTIEKVIQIIKIIRLHFDNNYCYQLFDNYT